MPEPRTSPGDPSPNRPRRVSRTLLTVMITGGLAVGGAGIAYAASATPTAPSPSASADTPMGPPAGHGNGGPGKHGHGPHANPATDSDGRITAVNGSSLTVADEFGQVHAYTLSSTTRIHQGPGQQLAATDLSVGEHVHVRGQSAATSGGTLQAVDVDVHPAHIDGVVTAVDGAGLTVTDRDGFTRHLTTSSSTRYDTAGQHSTADSIHPGSVLHAEGRVDSDGTTLDATTVTIRTAPSTAGSSPPAAPNIQPPTPSSGAPAPPSAGSTDQAPAPQSGQPSR